jgi:hypothetical protein
MHASASDEESHRHVQDMLLTIFDSNSDFWLRAPWMARKDDVKKVFQAIANENGDSSEVVPFGRSYDTTSRMSVEASAYDVNSPILSRSLSVKSTHHFEKPPQLEKPSFMTSEPLLQLHVERPELTGAAARYMSVSTSSLIEFLSRSFRYYDSEITSIIRYAHCSGKFSASTLDIVKKELFSYSVTALEEDIQSVGIEWETTGRLHRGCFGDVRSFRFCKAHFRLFLMFVTLLQCPMSGTCHAVHSNPAETNCNILCMLGTCIITPQQEEACKELSVFLENAE